MNLFDALATVTLLVAALTACRTSHTKTAQRAETALMSQWMTSCHLPSEAPKAVSPDAPTSTPKIYVELLMLERASSDGDPLASPRRSAGLLVASGVAANYDANGEAGPLAVAATLAPDAAHVALDVQVEGQRITHDVIPGESVRVDLPSSASTTAILTAYVIRSNDDLAELYACKKEHASHMRNVAGEATH
ncbi:hypothetical protein AKJ09_01251 [Labilithrix luteola]|uniref:Uncharacterized protein n=1 Tax=Labilithrix luteola TaxID=1391654 RepID=A0A0K1PM37_9BACT|nr:hypothetical protein [Labilithrix luteola]AKU94587.1 hypothetical protein AKJ09_01251 [Labilithrix luteola]